MLKMKIQIHKHTLCKVFYISNFDHREDLSHLPYLSMCIKEALRLHSPVPFIQRQLTQDTDLDGFLAPKGMLVNIIVYNIHHNPTVWEDSLVRCC